MVHPGGTSPPHSVPSASITLTALFALKEPWGGGDLLGVPTLLAKSWGEQGEGSPG